MPRAHRQTHRHLAVIRFARLPTVLPGHAHRMLPLLRKTRVVHDPRHYRTVLLHGGEHLLPHLLQHRLVVPRRRMTASAFCLVSRATSKGSPCWNFGRKSSTERGPAYSLPASFSRIRVSGLTPSPGMTRVELSKSSRGISGSS